MTTDGEKLYFRGIKIKQGNNKMTTDFFPCFPLFHICIISAISQLNSLKNTTS